MLKVHSRAWILSISVCGGTAAAAAALAYARATVSLARSLMLRSLIDARWFADESFAGFRNGRWVDNIKMKMKEHLFFQFNCWNNKLERNSVRTKRIILAPLQLIVSD